MARGRAHAATLTWEATAGVFVTAIEEAAAHDADVHQLVATFAPRDAVSNAGLLEMAGLSTGTASRTRSDAERVVHELEGRAGLLGDLEVAPDDIVLLHYSIWSQAVERALTAPGRLVVRYHNVTPPEWFVGVNPAVAELCARGRAGLGGSRRAACSASPRPPTTGSTSTAAGLRRDARPADRAAVAAGAPPAPIRPPVILYVGRLAPNKRVEELLRVFACYRRACELEARLAIVGTELVRAYAAACRSDSPGAARAGSVRGPPRRRRPRRAAAGRHRLPRLLRARGLLRPARRGDALRPADRGARLRVPSRRRSAAPASPPRPRPARPSWPSCSTSP